MKFTDAEKELVIAKLEHSLSNISRKTVNVLDVHTANADVRLFITLKDSYADIEIVDPNHDWKSYKNQYTPEGEVKA